MKLEGLKVKLPRGESAIENYFKNCEKRNKFINSNPTDCIKHLRKAKHDLNRAHSEFKDDVWDWAVIMAYYAIHHAGNGLLLKRMGYFSKDHGCLIIALKYLNLIKDDFFMRLRKIYEGFSDAISLDLTFELRKISQYSVEDWENVTRDDALRVLEIAGEFLKYVEGEVYDRKDIAAE